MQHSSLPAGTILSDPLLDIIQRNESVKAGTFDTSSFEPKPGDHIHIIGIAGVGMSALAYLLEQLGFIVQGSDASLQKGAGFLAHLKTTTLFSRHDPQNVQNVDLIVASSAVSHLNSELRTAHTLGIPIWSRTRLFSWIIARLNKKTIAISGTHGKTTITALLGHFLQYNNYDPTILGGGTMQSSKTHVRYGQGEWLVAEADESDGCFLSLTPHVGIISNIDQDHIETYGSFEKQKEAFLAFAQATIAHQGRVILCLDDPVVREVVHKLPAASLIPYGIDTPHATVMAHNISQDKSGMHFDVIINPPLRTSPAHIKDVYLPLYGRHNVHNALTVFAFCAQLNLDMEKARQSLAAFKGVKRRFTHLGSFGGIDVYDDYGHHPREISSALDGARALEAKRIIAVIQPHRYTRLKMLFDSFVTCCNSAERVFICDTYSAGEEPLEGAHGEDLVRIMQKSAIPLTSYLDIEGNLGALMQEVHAGDCVIFFGAGNITHTAQKFSNLLKQKYG